MSSSGRSPTVTRRRATQRVAAATTGAEQLLGHRERHERLAFRRRSRAGSGRPQLGQEALELRGLADGHGTTTCASSRVSTFDDGGEFIVGSFNDELVAMLRFAPPTPSAPKSSGCASSRTCGVEAYGRAILRATRAASPSAGLRHRAARHNHEPAASPSGLPQPRIPRDRLRAAWRLRADLL
jgi:hypothetical protein